MFVFNIFSDSPLLTISIILFVLCVIIGFFGDRYFKKNGIVIFKTTQKQENSLASKSNDNASNELSNNPNIEDLKEKKDSGVNDKNIISKDNNSDTLVNNDINNIVANSNDTLVSNNNNQAAANSNEYNNDNGSSNANITTGSTNTTNQSGNIIPGSTNITNQNENISSYIIDDDNFNNIF